METFSLIILGTAMVICLIGIIILKEIDIRIVLVVFLGIFFRLAYIIYPNKGIDYYKEGQIDALNGIVKYKLIENHDKTKEWVEIKKTKHGK